MNKTVKNWLITAAALILASAVLFVITLALCGWDITRLGTVNYATNTFEPSGDFKNITVNVYTADLELLPSEDGKCRVVCYEDEEVRHTAEVKDGALIIDTKDSRGWLGFISISFTRPTMTVYLPQNEYEFLNINTDTGNVYLPRGFTFESINIAGDTGAVSCSANVRGSVDIELDTGAMVISGVSAGNMKLGADTGRVSLDSVTCGDLRAETDTGDISLKNVVGTGKFELISDTGHIGLNGCDAAELYIETDTGGVSGELLTDKIFFADSDTGHVSVPKSVTGGKCEIKTDTGDIVVRVKR